MKYLAVLFLFATISTTHATEHDGGGGKIGNGGGGVVCRDPNQPLPTVYDYDIYVVSKIDQTLKINLDSDESEAEILKRVSKNLDLYEPGLKAPLELAMKEVHKRFKFVRSVPYAHDVTLKHLPDGCHFKPIGFWSKKTGRLLINQKLYSLMKPLNQIALQLHEALYFMYRERSGKNRSDEIQLGVARLLREDVDSQTNSVEGNPSDISVAKTGIVRKTVADDFTLWSVNWKAPADYASQNLFEVTVTFIGLSPLASHKVTTDDGRTFELSLANPVLHFQVKNDFSENKTTYGAHFSGLIGLTFTPDHMLKPNGDHVQHIARVEIKSLASGQELMLPFFYHAKKGRFAVRW